MKELLIAEKPDVARNNYLPLLEKISGEKFIQKQGYFESPSYYLTWFVGHLLEGLMPDEYNEKYKQWRIGDLPIIPEKFVNKIKADRAKQAHTILALSKESKCIICGTDADREGQRIFSSLMDYYKINLSTKRLWPSSYADDDLLELWKKMKDMKEWEGWTKAAEMRNETDWLIGMNATRAYTVIGGTSLPIGRVLTATLALVVERDYQVENFKESFYFMIKAQWGGIGFTFYEGKEKKFEDEIFCKRKLEELTAGNFSISEFQKENKKENPPRPYSQADLQIDADKKFGFPAMKTLEISQSLYEKKLLTYPRTDSTNLPKSDYPKYLVLIDKNATAEERNYLLPEGEKPDFVIDKEEPHSAIVITSQNPSGLGPEEAKIYELVRNRFILSFMKPALYIQYDLGIRDEMGNLLKARIRQDTFSGFKAFFKPEQDAEEEGSDTQILVINEDRIKQLRDNLQSPRIEKIKRSKPQYFTTGTLLKAMENCGKKLEREEDRRIMAEKEHPGIGTPATQAPTIQQLIEYEYVRQDKSKIMSTLKGRKIINIIAPDLKTPALTATWELKLKKIQDLEMTVERYREDLHGYVQKIIDDAKKLEGKIDFKAGEKTEYSCPACKKAIMKKQWGYSCESKECGFSISNKIAEKDISDKQIESLLKDGETALVKGFKGSKGPFDAKLVIRDRKQGHGKEVGFEFEFIPCPKCKTGSMRFFQWGASCTQRNVCDFNISREIAQKKLPDSAMKKLLLHGKTATLSGFKNKEGREFSAQLIIDKAYKTKFTFE